MQPVPVVLPPNLQPYSFFAFSATILVVCALLNITTLIFGIPAIVLSMQVCTYYGHMKWNGYWLD